MPRSVPNPPRATAISVPVKTIKVNPNPDPKPKNKSKMPKKQKSVNGDSGKNTDKPTTPHNSQDNRKVTPLKCPPVSNIELSCINETDERALRNSPKVVHSSKSKGHYADSSGEISNKNITQVVPTFDSSDKTECPPVELPCNQPDHHIPEEATDSPPVAPHAIQQSDILSDMDRIQTTDLESAKETNHALLSEADITDAQFASPFREDMTNDNHSQRSSRCNDEVKPQSKDICTEPLSSPTDNDCNTDCHIEKSVSEDIPSDKMISSPEDGSKCNANIYPTQQHDLVSGRNDELCTGISCASEEPTIRSTKATIVQSENGIQGNQKSSSTAEELSSEQHVSAPPKNYSATFTKNMPSPVKDVNDMNVSVSQLVSHFTKKESERVSPVKNIPLSVAVPHVLNQVNYFEDRKATDHASTTSQQNSAEIKLLNSGLVETGLMNTDAVNTGPVKIDPVNTDTVHTEVMNTNTVHTDVIKIDTEHTNVIKSDTVPTDVKQIDTMPTDVIKTDTVNTDVIQIATMHTDLTKTDTMPTDVKTTGSFKSDTLHTDAVETDTVYRPTATVHTDVINTDTVHTDVIKTNTLPTDVIETDTVNTDKDHTDVINTDTVNTDTVLTDVIKTDTVNTDTVLTDLIKTDIITTDTVYTDRIETDTVNIDKHHTDVIQTATANTDLLKTDTVHTDVIKTDLVEAVNTDSVATNFFLADEVNTDTVSNKSMKTPSEINILKSDDFMAKTDVMPNTDSVKIDDLNADEVSSDTVDGDSMKSDPMKTDSEGAKDASQDVDVPIPDTVDDNNVYPDTRENCTSKESNGELSEAIQQCSDPETSTKEEPVKRRSLIARKKCSVRRETRQYSIEYKEGHV